MPQRSEFIFSIAPCKFSVDVGMCEVVMVGEAKQLQENIFSKEPFQDSEQSDEEEDDEDAGSYDLQINADYSLRERSMTAARLEKLEYHSKKTAKIKHVKWESKADKNTDDNVAKEELFIIKQKEDQSTETKSKKSALATLIEKSTNIPPNPYMGYAKFDGSGQINIPTRTYRIYLTMLPEDQRNYPLDVTCIATAKIQDLIGLILLKFSTNNASEYSMKPVLNYGLYITEEDGEVDSDFSHLEPNECVAKFGFTCLGLVEHNGPQKGNSGSDSYQVDAASPDSSGKKRTTSSSKAEETKQIRHDLMIMDVHNKAMEAPLYKSYRVSIANKLLWWNIEVNLGISNEKIEIDPIAQKNTKLQLVKQTPVSHPMDSIAWCEETESRGNKSSFRVVYAAGYGTPTTDLYSPSFSLSSSSLQSSPSFKHYDFEAEKSIADEIVQKINLILKLRSSHCRREYLAAKERKHLSKRKSFKYLRP